MTAYQLQKALNISPSVAAKIYSDEFEMISRKSLDRLCKVLDVTPADLISYEADRETVGRSKKR